MYKEYTYDIIIMSKNKYYGPIKKKNTTHKVNLLWIYAGKTIRAVKQKCIIKYKTEIVLSK